MDFDDFLEMVMIMSDRVSLFKAQLYGTVIILVSQNHSDITLYKIALGLPDIRYVTLILVV